MSTQPVSPHPATSVAQRMATDKYVPPLLGRDGGRSIAARPLLRGGRGDERLATWQVDRPPFSSHKTLRQKQVNV
ncbi:hypothetical protein EON67_10735 [archaeon]|nr:MAG: hypothetical protein EON67_10735 [archaeon]